MLVWPVGELYALKLCSKRDALSNDWLRIRADVPFIGLAVNGVAEDTTVGGDLADTKGENGNSSRDDHVV